MKDPELKDSKCTTCQFGIMYKMVRREVIMIPPDEPCEQHGGIPQGDLLGIRPPTEADQIIGEDNMVGGSCLWPVVAFPGTRAESIPVQVVLDCSRHEPRNDLPPQSPKAVKSKKST